MTRDEIVDRVAAVTGIDPENEEEVEELGVILFDGMEDAFLGVAERFEKSGHRYFIVYSYAKMVEILMRDADESDDVETRHEEAVEYLEFNTVGLYAGPGTPAILRDMED
jgi:hypothetical protein